MFCFFAGYHLHHAHLSTAISHHCFCLGPTATLPWLPPPRCSPTTTASPQHQHRHNCRFVVLTGHANNAEFAIAMCPSEPYVLSGDKPSVFGSSAEDGCVNIWDYEQVMNSLISLEALQPTGDMSSVR
ncbi:hypothetical protein L2E82_18117 [Cichorium intybus]|uniref:Uncharacterized protein n=1 Tax=Cichorium intybus TaxID=13427 RepID=A0ACB9FAQ8_CICIN|nr:hypothetical protein L2E82_18117 [Cichorium intybus]